MEKITNENCTVNEIGNIKIDEKPTSTPVPEVKRKKLYNPAIGFVNLESSVEEKSKPKYKVNDEILENTVPDWIKKIDELNKMKEQPSLQKTTKNSKTIVKK